MKNKRLRLLPIFIISSILMGCNKTSLDYFPYGNEAREIVYKASGDSVDVSSLMSENIYIPPAKSYNGLVDKPKFNSKSIIVAEGEDGFYSKNCYKKMYPASLTKLMLAYIVLSGDIDLSRTIKIRSADIKLEDVYAKKMGLMEGDEISLIELINATLVYSANDAAKAIAVNLAGSEEEFAKLMTEKARELGATKTNYINSTGLHSKAQYTTLYDQYLIFKKLLENPKFVEIIQQDSYTVNYKNLYGNKISKKLKSTNQYLTGNIETPAGYKIVGGKTGTTDEAGYCILLSVDSNLSDKYIVGVLKAQSSLNLYAEINTILEALPK